MPHTCGVRISMGTDPFDRSPLEGGWTDPLIGSLLADYRIDALLGEGGMGRVYAGVDIRTLRRVAVKVIGEEHARDAELIARFYAEANAASRIRHANIIEVLALVSAQDGRPAIVMELVEGSTLRGVIEAEPIAIDRALDIFAQVLGAIAAAHAAGIVHRDLKPDNILVTPSGVAKVLDFGIAKLATLDGGEAALRTRTGMMLGTPDYMAPEQITGMGVDARTDIYALGVVLFETLTTRRPFASAASPFELLRAHMEASPPWPGDVRAEIPDALSSVIVTAMAKAPADRFPTVDAMQAALSAARGGGRARAPVTLPRTRAPRRQWPWVVAAMCVLLAIAIGATMVAKHRADKPRVTIARVTTTAPPPRPDDDAAADYRNDPPPASLRAYDLTAAQDGLTRLARTKLPDAQLYYMLFRDVRADGTVDLEASQSSPVWMFWSPAVAAKRPEDLPPNQPYRAMCQAIVTASKQWTQVVRAVDTCDRTVTPPTCTVRAIWERAKKQGADPKYVAEISFVDGVWGFRIYNVPAQDQKSLQWPDDCALDRSVQ